MSAVQSTMTEKAKLASEPSSQQIESLYEKGDTEAAPTADYSGATAKTNPDEIALVKKLDYRIMPILWAMYFMNYRKFLSILPTSTPTPCGSQFVYYHGLKNAYRSNYLRIWESKLAV